MSQGATDDAPTTNASDSPFEWLTNFRSLRHLVLPSRIVFGSSRSKPDDGCFEASSASSHASDRRKDVRLNALHVGCGTSTVGESLLGLRERTRDHALRYGCVINVDNDTTALDSMQRRWEKRRPRNMDDDTDQGDKIGSMEWKHLDFKSEESCRSTLDCVHRQLSKNDNATSADHPGGCFDLVLDKSTLDCLLCAETNVVAQFLYEVYRALRVPTSTENDPIGIDIAVPSSWGGVYVLVTFHPAEFVERLLTQLPGADWHVEHEVIKREVEDVNRVGVWTIDEVTHQSRKENPNSSTESPCTTSAWSSGTFQPDENYRKTVSVFTCRRCCTHPKFDPPPLPTYILDKEKICEHVEKTCDDWYQTTNPMVTCEREEQLRASFSEAVAAKMTTKSEAGEDREMMPNEAILDMKECYEILFTDAEKEHLTYEYFLEDWDAYFERSGKRVADAAHPREGMTISIALDFLKEMQ